MTDGPRLAYISIGTNVGDRLANVRSAVELLGNTPGVAVLRTASLYETEPWGERNQPWFLNSALEISTTLPPRDLLGAVKAVERAMGRTLSYRWGPREIDLDILLYEGVRWDAEALTIPHPRMRERLFVLLPLMELLPDWQDEDGTGIGELIEGLRGSTEVREYPAKL